MTTDRSNQPLSLDSLDHVTRFRDDLDRLGYCPIGIAEKMKIHPQEILSFRGLENDLHLIRHHLDSRSSLDNLIRLFLLGDTLPPDLLERSLTSFGCTEGLSLGLLEQREHGIGAAFQLIPFEHLLFAVDPWWVPTMAENYVLGIGGPTLNLAQMTIRRPSRSTLDVGSGCGIQAFLAAPHSQQVVGVDRNVRAVNVATFNAQLNRLSNTTFLPGDLYSPITDRKFDLIVANPPYVISPESTYLYRDSGLKGDEIAQRVIREGTPLLEEGGYLQLICEWAHLAGQSWHQRIGQWFQGTACDVWVNQFTTVDTSTHAAIWLRGNHDESLEVFSQHHQRWLDYYNQQGIEAISDGVITLRKRSNTSNWYRIDKAPQRIGPCGPSIERGFAAVDFLQRVSDDQALMHARVHIAPEICWEQRLTPTSDGWQVNSHQLYITSGMAYRGEVDRRCITLIDNCRGHIAVGSVIEHLREPGSGPEQEQELLSLVRGLIEQGFLLPCE